jgi:hypothetical protein
MTEPQYTYDVFVSYSSNDRAWLRGELLPRLEGAGLRVCVDYRDFRAGAPKASEVERAVLASRKMLRILTPDYLASEWDEFGGLMVQSLDPAARDRRLIPLLRAPCQLPLCIRHLTYVDFADPADSGIAWIQLLTALGAPPLQQPHAEPAREQWRLAHPYAMPPNFTGRLAERALLSDWLNGDGSHPLLAIRALGGFGKSALTWHWLLHDVFSDLSASVIERTQECGILHVEPTISIYRMLRRASHVRPSGTANYSDRAAGSAAAPPLAAMGDRLRWPADSAPACRDRRGASFPQPARADNSPVGSAFGASAA